MRVGGDFFPPLQNIPGLAGKHPVPKVSNATTLGAPVGGINARDAIANMDPSDALDMVNFFPSTLGCVVRNGWTVHSYNISGSIDTIADHYLANGTSYLYVFAGAVMLDVTIGGDASGFTPLVSGLTNARWQWINYPSSGGVYWIGVNGVDNPIIIGPDHVAHRLVSGDGVTAYTISGANPATFTSITVHQHRIWFCQANNTICYYLPPNVMWGTVQPFDFGPLFKKGGCVLVQIAWTVDAGDGPDDRLCMFSSGGEVAVYAGTDPTSASGWTLNGVFFIGRPVGIRCVTKFGGDVAVLCDQGLASLNSVLISTTVNTRTTFFTDKIQQLISAETSAWAEYFGWQPFVFPQQNMLMINIPDPNWQTGLQYVMNTITGAWTKFTGLQANSWVNSKESLYCGTVNGIVAQGLSGFLDGSNNYTGAVGNDINCQVVTSFSYFENPGAEKNFTMVRPNLIGINRPSVTVQANMQFDQGLPPYPSYAQAVFTPLWDTAKWDSTAWTGGTNSYNDWYGVVGIGYAACLAMRLKVKDQVSWASTDWVFQIQKGTAL
jgi:hypothetical protein